MFEKIKEKNKQVLLILAGIILQVFGESDRDLQINRVIIKRRFWIGKVYKIIIYSSRPGLIIGRKGIYIDSIISELKKEFGDSIELQLIDHEVLPILSRYKFPY